VCISNVGNKFSALGQKQKGKEFNEIYSELMKDKKEKTPKRRHKCS